VLGSDSPQVWFCNGMVASGASWEPLLRSRHLHWVYNGVSLIRLLALGFVS
jgi:hypothetical protein